VKYRSIALFANKILLQSFSCRSNRDTGRRRSMK